VTTKTGKRGVKKDPSAPLPTRKGVGQDAAATSRELKGP